MNAITPSVLTTTVFEGHLRAEQPLATCPPGQWTDTKKPAPITTMLVMQDGVAERRMFFPGSGMRGRLRRAAVELLIDQAGGESPFSLDDYMFLSRGGIKADGKESRGDDVMAAQALRDRNPLVSLFGASTPWMSGKLQVGCAIAAIAADPTVFTGVRRDLSDAELSNIGAQDIEEWRARAAATAARSKDKGRVKALKADAAKAQKAGKAEEAKKLKADADALEQGITGVSVQLPLPGYEAIPQGMELRHRFVLQHATAEELGLFLATLNHFSTAPFLGAHAATGCGMVSGAWDVKTAVGESLGRIELNPFTPLIYQNAEALLAATEAWRVYASTLNVDDFRLMASSVASTSKGDDDGE